MSNVEPPAPPPPLPPFPPTAAYPPPPSNQYVAPTKKKRKIWPWVVAACLVPILLIGGCTAFVIRAAKGPIDTANNFLSHIADRDFDEAFELVDPDCFADGDLPAIQAFFTEQELTSYDLSGTSVENGAGAATGTITLNGSDERAIDFQLTKDDGWKICGIDIE